jgi:hypothetical protein
MKNSFVAYLLSGITNVIENGNKDHRFNNIIGFLSLYSLTQPRKMAKVVNKITNNYLYKNNVLTSKEERALSFIQDHFNRNIKTITRIATQQEQLYKSIHKEVTTNLSREIMRDLKRWKRLPDGTVASFEEINTKLRDKYSKSKNRVERIIRTETHAQNELVKHLDMKARGYKEKIWVNQKDNKVRTSHKGSPLTTTWIDIDKKFNLTGTSETAMFPGDNTLSAGERINCRCFAKYRR